MDNFTSILSNTKVASSLNGVTVSNDFKNINGVELISRFKKPTHGTKDGSYYLRTNLKTNDNGMCLPRADANTHSLANVFIIDCDKRIDINTGEQLQGAPDPYQVSDILIKNNIGHILYGSYSHYVGNVGNRYRVILAAETPYNADQLEPTLAEVISLINTNLDGDLLVSATENGTWSQPWYYPRKPQNSSVAELYIEYLEGEAIKVIEPVEPPPKTNKKKCTSLKEGEISPINAFNQQNPLSSLLNFYGYKKIYSTKNFEKWLSSDSTTGIAGIRVEGDRFFSHHGSCPFNDGYWHDAFDLMRVSEKLSEREAVIKAAQQHKTADESQFCDNSKPQKLIPHAGILNRLLDKVIPVSFREIANITDEKEKLKPYHFYVIVIETILQLATKNNWGLCRNHDFIYLYNGEFWSLIDEDELKAFLGNAAEKMAVDKFSARYFNFRDQLYKQFLTQAHLPKPVQSKDAVFVNLKNGTFEITPTGTQLKDFSSNDFITYQLPFEFNPNAKAPLFQKYLDKVLPDKKLQSILSEYLGYVFISPSTLKLEKTLLLYGSGANGKSVFYEIVRSLLGEQNTSEYSLQTLTNESGYQRAMIANKLVNYASEINGKLESSIFKQLVSGEAVEARLPYGNPFIMTEYAKLIFNCNELPRDVEQTQAYFRRFLIVPFNVAIPEPEQDRQLSKKIIDTELSGVFNWVLDGLKRLLVQKQFTDSEQVRNALAQYEKDSDSVKLFLDETGYRSNADSYVSIKIFYPEYRNFCLDNGYKPVSNINFRKRLENSNIVVEKKNIGNVAFASKCNFTGNPNEYSQAKWGCA